ncbi:hypothetical protein B0H17DRAFT_1208283 [Mycena rosella]|uniref:Uncharacterized protein n=1 Tax=Mycena rosella TaxID=1033263 RepID=A0AAD7D2G4_MYCRO|nr:hypothetical protein B0H17DRAFT_1208283 [Mycena rosella]
MATSQNAPVTASSQATSDWLATSLTTAKGVAAAAECIPFPYVVILGTVEKVKKNRDDLKELCGNIMEIIKIIQDQLSSHGDTAAAKFKGLCEDFDGRGSNILNMVQQLKIEPQGLSSRFKEVMKLGSTADKISAHRTKIQELRLNFLVNTVSDVRIMPDI